MSRWSMIFVVCVAVLGASVSFADDPKPVEPGPWAFQATAGLNLSQSSFSSNWSGGDKGSIVWTLQGDGTGERQFTRSFNLKNQLQLAYGQAARQVADATGNLNWDRPDKTTDLIMFESTGRFSLETFVDPYLSLRLDSQFRDESSSIGVIQFNPIKLKEAAGVARVLEKTADREVITRFGFGFRQTLAQSFVDPVTRAKDRFVSNDGGFEWQTSITRPVLEKKVLYKAQLLMFQPVFYSKSGALEDFDARARLADPAHVAVADFWKATDINFQNLFSAAITKTLSVNLTAQWVYDKFDAAANVDSAQPLAQQQVEIARNTRKAGQFKETLAVGLSYRLF